MKKRVALTKKYLRYCFVLLGLVVGYMLFALASCLLPNGVIHKNITNTIERGDLREDYPKMGIPLSQCQQDNFTDALILNQAWRVSSDSLLTSMLLLPRASGPDPAIMNDCLWRMVHGEDWGTLYYARYWHGGTFAVRFLLLLGSYQTVRLILYIITMLLLVALCMELGRERHSWVALLMVAGMSLTYPFVAQTSMQFAPVLIIALSGALLVCRLRGRGESVSMLMFILGSVTAFMDLLTTPLLTLGFPLALWLVLDTAKPAHKSWLTSFSAAFGKIMLWGMGFAATWASKWLIATICTPLNVFKDAADQAAMRSDVGDFSRLDAAVINLRMVHWGLMALILIVLVVLAIVRFRKQNMKTAVMLALLGCMPLAWFFVVANHSYLHWWFTYRLLMVTAVSWLLAVGVLVDWQALEPRRSIHLRRKK